MDDINIGFGSEDNMEFPLIVNVQVYSGDCVCSCVHCPVGVTPRDQRKRRFGNRSIDIGLYRKIIDEISEHPHSAIRVHSVGEPLLWKALPDALEYTKGRGVTSWLFTSAVTGRKRLLERLCESTDVLEISVNSTTREDYHAKKGVDRFDMVTRNLEYMSRFIEERELPTRLMASRVQTEDRIADEAFVTYWKGTGLLSDAFVRSHHTYNDQIGGLSGTMGTEHQPCLVHWARFNIDTEGNAIVCFNELFRREVSPELVYGNVRDTSIAGIWSGYRMNALRMAELSGDYSAMPDCLPCKECTSCQPLFGDRQTSEHQLVQLRRRR